MVRTLAMVGIVVLSMVVVSQAAPPKKTSDGVTGAKATLPKITVSFQTVITIGEADQTKRYLCLLPQDKGMTTSIDLGFTNPAVVLRRENGFAADGIWSPYITLMPTTHKSGEPSWMVSFASVGKGVTFLDHGFRGWQLSRQDSIKKIYQQFAASQGPPRESGVK